MKDFLLSPSLLSADFLCLGSQVAELEAAGVDWLHIDVMDGVFVPNISMGPPIVSAVRRASNLPLDVHLMIVEPERHLLSFAHAGADMITVHLETCPHLQDSLQQIKSLDCRCGVALKPDTFIDQLDPILALVDLVLILGNNPGFSGQKFLSPMLDKISQLRRRLDAIQSEAVLQVDGGMTLETLPLAQEAGADCFVAGNAILKHPGGICAGVRQLRGMS